jgi:ABC-2 type transport system permease protein
MGSGLPLPLAAVFAGVLTGTVLANQFGNDGPAYAGHVLTGVPGRTELRARATALALIMVPLLVAFTSVMGLVTHGLSQLPAALGTVLAGFAVSAAVSSGVSVLAPYALPDSQNPFAMSGGSAGAKGFLALAGMLGSMGLVSPVLALALAAPRSWGALVLLVGLAWGAVVLGVGTYLAGYRLDLRGPEILGAVTPRR